MDKHLVEHNLTTTARNEDAAEALEQNLNQNPVSTSTKKSANTNEYNSTKKSDEVLNIDSKTKQTFPQVSLAAGSSAKTVDETTDNVQDGCSNGGKTEAAAIESVLPEERETDKDNNIIDKELTQVPFCECKHSTTRNRDDKLACRQVFLLSGTYYMDRKFTKRIQRMDSVAGNELQPPIDPVDYGYKLRVYACPKSIRPLWKSDEVVSWFTVIFVLFSILCYVGNILSDLLTAYYLYKSECYWWFSISVIFSIMPTLVVNFFSYLWYVKEEGLCGYLKPHTFSRTPFKRRIYRFTTHVFFTSIIFRQIDILCYAFKIRRELKMLPRSCGNETFYIYARERRDTALLVLIESFVRDIPQFTLQLYIWTWQHNSLSAISCDFFCLVQYVSIFLSIVWFSCSIVNFQQSIRVSRKRKKQFGLPACLLQFVWRLGTTGARIFAIILITSTYPGSALMIILLHWGLMCAWILRWKLDVAECPRQNDRSWKICLDRGYACLMGAIYIFCFLNTTNRRSARKLKKYYSVTAAEDTVFVLLWYMKMNSPVFPESSHPWLFAWRAIIYYTAFITGISAMILYYKKFHPTTEVKETDSPVDLHYFDSNLDLVVVKNWRQEPEQFHVDTILRKPCASVSSTSSDSSNSDTFNYSIVQNFYTSSSKQPQ